MAAQNRDIELLPKEEWEKTSLGKFVKWVLTVGRYIVIFTELIVISAFISRFKLDRDLSRIYEDIERKQSLVAANSDFEADFRRLKSKIEFLEKIEKEQTTNQSVLDQLTPLIPINVSLTNFSIKNKNEITLKATALSEEGLASFINNLQKSPRFTELNITNVQTGSEKTIGVNFTLNCQYLYLEQEA